MTAIVASQDLDSLLGKIGAKLDLTITETSTPNAGQVCDWMNEAALLLARLLPPRRLGSLRAAPVSNSDTGEFLDLSGTDMLRVVGVKKYGVECTVLDQRRMDLVATRYPLVHTVRNPSVCVSGDTGSVQLQFWPTSSGPVTITGIRKPTAYHNEQTGGSYTWVPDTYSMPAELEHGCIDYVVIQGRVQDEEPQQVQQLYAMWTQQMGIETKVPGLGVE